MPEKISAAAMTGRKLPKKRCARNEAKTANLTASRLPNSERLSQRCDAARRPTSELTGGRLYVTQLFKALHPIDPESC